MNPPDKNIITLTESNAFVQLLGQLNSGRVITELAEKFPLIVEAVKANGQKGALTLTLRVIPDGKGEIQTVDVQAEIKLKLPERGQKATTFFVVNNRELSRSDPNQPELRFPEAAAKQSAARG